MELIEGILIRRNHISQQLSTRASKMTVRARKLRFKMLSTNRGIFDHAIVATPVLAIGQGTIRGNGAQLGFWPSPHVLDGVIHLEARYAQSSITIGHGVVINNGCVLISEGPGIDIGDQTLIGPQVSIFDSDFHSVNPHERRKDAAAKGQVSIGRNVFIGANCCIMKGVTIGDNSVIGAGAIVTGDIPSNVVAAGNPCRVLRHLDPAG